MVFFTHPTNEVVQQAFVTHTGSRLEIQLYLIPGTTAAPGFAKAIDTDGDETISAAESAAHLRLVESTLGLRVDGQAVPLARTEHAYPAYDVLAAGGGTVLIELEAALPEGGTSIAFTDDYAPGRTIVQLDALAGPVDLESITHTDEGRTLVLESASTGLWGFVGAALDLIRAGYRGCGRTLWS